MRRQRFLLLAMILSLASLLRAETPTTIPAPFVLTVGPTTCPTFAINFQPYDLKTQRPLPALKGPLPPIFNYAALSPDGQLFALTFPNTDAMHPNGKIVVWSTRTGSIAVTRPAPDIGFIGFAGNDTLVSHAPFESQCTLYNLKTQTSRTVNVQAALGIGGIGTAVSPDGHYAAIQRTGREGTAPSAGVITSLVGKPNTTELIFPRYRTGFDVPTSEAATATNGDTTCVFAFSNDSTRLAVLRLDPRRLLVWTVDGKRVADIPVPTANLKSFSLRWLPDDSGWLIDDVIIRASDQHAVVHLPATVNSRFQCFPSQDQLLTVTATADGQSLKSIPLPWEKVRTASAAAADASVPAVLRPGSAVSLEWKADGLFSKAPEDKALLEALVRYRLRADGISVAPESAVKLVVEYTSEPGPTLRNSRGPTDATVNCTLRLSLTNRAGDVTYWKFEPGVDSVRAWGSAGGRKFDATLLAANHLAEEILVMPTPWFISSDTPATVLPLNLPE